MSVLIPDAGKPDYLPIFAIVAGLMVVAVVVLVNTVKENKLVEEMERLQGMERRVRARARQRISPAPGCAQEPAVHSCFHLLVVYGLYAVTTAWSKYAQTVLGLAGGIRQ